ncbi:hypothetical protein TrVFT333_011584 [Trichoderma virens FT-333]|nr:hypothetical protein TrVFT333_011584 [Trichoderma virens FT-333]
MASLDIVPGWKHYSKSATHLTNVCRYCPFLPYLSLVVPRNSAVKTSRKVVVRRIVFTTTSHDQGQLDDKSLEGKSEGKLEGKYDGSQTWFSARVLDPAGRDRFPEQRIHTNVAASREFRTHVNCWDHREPAGQGKWLSSIESGDHIQIVPTASRDGWVNFIQGARIDIWVEEIDQKPDLEHGLLGSQDPSVYRPLSLQRKEIRLVVIEPQDNDDDTIRVSLQYLSLDEPEGTPFEALSYCWGSVQDLKPIMMKNPDASKPDFEFQVTSNLFSALKHLRRPHVSRTFWIDLICINQSNIEERNRQVGLMGRIFALAKHVRVWLGEFDEEVAAEFAIMRTIARKQQNPEPLADASLESLPAHMPRTHSDIFSDKAITPHDKVFQKPWFYRIWVLQEVWSSSLISPSDEIDRVTV